MTEVFFLEADTPLTKNFSVAKDGSVEKSSYPFVRDFTSHRHEINGVEALYKAILQHAPKGHCLLKGTLNRPLKNESRAGSTDSFGETQWICFDLDKVGSFASVDEFMTSLGMGDVSYIVQYSSSYGVAYHNEPLDTRLSAHVFVWLDTPLSAKLLKQWLIQLNFEHPQLAGELKLTASTNSLSYGLDITTCQNDKLLYITPPGLKGEGLVDTLGRQRIKLVSKPRKTLSIDPTRIASLAANYAKVDERVNELRKSLGMPLRKKTTLKTDSKLNVEYLAKPDQAVVTGVKHERGFVYLNLNGGDSWGYFFPEDQPEVLQNFKGEPNYLLKEIAPDFYQRFKSQLSSAKNEHLLSTREKERETGRYYLAFRDFSTAVYYNGWYDRDSDELVLNQAKSEKQLRDFLKQYGLELGEFVPDWRLVFDPANPVTLDADNHLINRYKPTAFEYLELHEPAPTPTIFRLIAHALGVQAEDPADDDVFLHFINWLAFVLQKKKPAGTCWVLHGTTGTGKGILYNRVLRPLIGEANTKIKRTEDLGGNFNGWMENSLLTLVDEVHMSQLLSAKLLNAKLKSWIVEPFLNIEEKFQLSHQARNYNNFIFTSNEVDPVHIDHNDRRFNVANFQHQKLPVDDAFLDAIERELEDFYMLLMQYGVDERAARTPIQTEAREEMMSISRSAIDVMVDSLLQGHLTFFFDQLPDDETTLTPLQTVQLDGYKAVLREWLDSATTGKPHVMRDHFRIACDWCVGGMPDTPYKFTKFIKHHGAGIKQILYRGTMVQGIPMRWEAMDAATLAAMDARLSETV